MKDDAGNRLKAGAISPFFVGIIVAVAVSLLLWAVLWEVVR